MSQRSHFYRTFGYLLMPSFFTGAEMAWISQEFDGILRDPGIKACCADHSARLAMLTDHPRVVQLVTSLFGKDWLYKGSDGNVFVNSSPWHRDYFIKTQTCKMLMYLDGSTLDVLPGSHFVEGPFSSRLNAALTWPEPPVRGGFDEKGLLSNDGVPFVRIEAKPGDVIVFSHNLIHRTVEPKRRRRLLGLHFAEAFTEELRELTLIEMRTFAVASCYGPHVKRTPRTAPFFDLSSVAGEFSGKYESQSAESVEFGRRNMG